MMAFIPTRSMARSLGVLDAVKLILTGIRCCTLTKFPVELSTGTAEYLEPVASDIAATSPSKVFPANASISILTFVPKLILFS